MAKPQYTVSIDLGSNFPHWLNEKEAMEADLLELKAVSSSLKVIKDPAMQMYNPYPLGVLGHWVSLDKIKVDGTEHSPIFIVLETFDGFRKTIEWKQPGPLPPQIVDKYDEPFDYFKDMWLTPSSVITSTLRFFQRTGMPYLYKELYPHKKEKTNESAAKLAA